MAKEKREKKKGGLLKKVILGIVVVFVILCVIGALNDGNSGNDVADSHIYDSAEVIDVMNGSGTEKIGEYSLIKADSSEITEDVLADWYFNYVEKNDFNWCVILYSDKSDSTGVYSGGGFVEVGLILEDSGDGVYMAGDTSSATMYTPSDGKLVKQE